ACVFFVSRQKAACELGRCGEFSRVLSRPPAVAPWRSIRAIGRSSLWDRATHALPAGKPVKRKLPSAFTVTGRSMGDCNFDSARRSEERRVGKEGRSRERQCTSKKKQAASA